ncbi:universal stress protein [Paraburkholderia tropica]|uniref:universal stress protein n=1 Tax=Paraburkholderia tropica TaxID=92647 RepID=UPI002AB74678|nr:universal stress protein [Paraburkholderia tropica]
MREVLLGYDGSDCSRRALTFAIDLAQRYGARLHVVSVARSPDFEFGLEIDTDAIAQQQVLHCQRLLDALRHSIPELTRPVRYEVASGHPAEEIIRYAQEEGVDHIVVGHRGHTLLERWLIGSIARHVIAHAGCSVTVVR